MKITKKTGKMQAKIIKPHLYFKKSYVWILKSLGKTVTKGESKLLILLYQYGKKNKKIQIDQKTLADKMEISTRQVQRILQALVKKGFLTVTNPTYSDRSKRESNTYNFIEHPSYEGKDHE